MVLVAAVVAAAFGAADQYLGSLSAHPWAADVSLLSAPWLLLAFVAGATQRAPRKAAIVGCACTFAALVGYGLITLSPLENAHVTAQTLRAFSVSEARVLIGGLVSGPLFGWLGHRWRTRRSLLAGLSVAVAVVLEPFAHDRVGNAIRVGTVAASEVTLGAALLFYVGTARIRRQALGARRI